MSVLLVRRFAPVLVAAAAAWSMSGPAAADYPERSVQYLIPFAAGGESDVVARFQQQAFAQKFRQEMVVINRPGGGGALVWQQLNTLPGDGYTIAGINLPHIVLQPIEGSVSYKTDDLVSVYWFHYTPDALIVPATSPYRTFQDFVAAAKEKPGSLSIAGSALYSANHVAHERLNRDFKVKTEYVPFKGTGDLVASVLGGHVAGAMSYTTLAIQQKGKMRMLAVATKERHPQFPDVPTFRELGVDWVDGAYRGVAVPKSTPEAVRRQVSGMMEALNKDPDMRKKMVDGGFEVIDVPYDQVPAFMKERTAQYTETARQLGMIK
ncbi:MAG TPA: tripartite tricarboxylate transporter substrate binding protein [Casimicrobiaceae bacterium]|nr:tripartite tricarboxylate transporter substrate binding protein [Casimicrobiaceae bacterium]